MIKTLLIISTLVILIIIVILSFAIYRVYNYCKKYEYARSLKFALVSEIYNDLKSGDIILYQSNVFALYNILITHSFFAHSGMIVKNDITGELYITESNPLYEEVIPNSHFDNIDYELDPKDIYIPGIPVIKSGVTFIPFDVRIKYYSGFCYVMRLNKELNHDQKQELLNDQLENIEYPTYLQMFGEIIEKMKIKMKMKKEQLQEEKEEKEQLQEEKEQIQEEKGKKMHCFQYVGYLLDKIGITNSLYLYNTITIGNAISQLYNKELNNGYLYESPIKLIYDIK